MIRSNLRFSFVLAGTLLFASCAVKKTDAPTPDKGQSQTEARQLSTINIPVRINLKELENRINTQFSGVLYDDNSYDGDNLLMKISKLDNFTITATGNQFQLNAPIEIYVKGRIKKELFNIFNEGYGIDQSKDATFRINVKIKSKLGMTADWDIQTQSTAAFEWREKPYLEVGPVKIPIGSLIESVINSQVNEINKRLDTEITRQIKLKPQIENYWNQLQQPVLVEENYKTYLQIKPEYVSLAPINSDGKNIFINIGVRSDFNLVSGEKPVLSQLKPLPKLQLNQKPDSTFHLFFGGELTYEYATELARNEFKGKTFEYENGKQKVTINDLKIFSNGDRLAMMLDVSGKVKNGIFSKKFKGVVYALGVPVYNAATQTVTVKNFDFDVKSKDVLVGATEWLFKGNFRKQIESRLSYPVKADLDRAKKMAQAALDNTSFGTIRLNGKIDKIEPVGVYIGERSLKVVIQSTGNLNVKLQGF